MILRPKPEVNGHTHNPSIPLKVYPSLIPRAMTFAVDIAGDDRFRHGLRLDIEQVTALRDRLTAWIEEQS